jgi:asparaginyl-tRNA synthetase
MKNVLIKSLYRDTEAYLGKQIKIAGWVRTSRNSKEFGFIEVNDGSFFRGLQIVFDNKLDNFSELEKINIGSSLEVEGELVKSPAAGQAFELKALKITVIFQAGRRLSTAEEKTWF